MSREKQIEEIARTLCTTCDGDTMCKDISGCIIEQYAEVLYNAGYRKQSEGEWVKVYQNKKAIVYECSNCGHLTLGTSDYCICGAKMKDGE